MALLAALYDGSSVELEAVEGMIHGLFFGVLNVLHSFLLHLGPVWFLLHLHGHIEREQVSGLFDRPVIDVVHLDLVVSPRCRKQAATVFVVRPLLELKPLRVVDEHY